MTTTDIVLMTKMQAAHRAVDDVVASAHRIATEHDYALKACRDELHDIVEACRMALGTDVDGARDGVSKLLEQRALECQEAERLRAEAVDLTRQLNALRDALTTVQMAHAIDNARARFGGALP